MPPWFVRKQVLTSSDSEEGKIGGKYDLMASSLFHLELEDASSNPADTNAASYSAEPIVVSVSDGDDDSDCQCLDPVTVKKPTPKTVTVGTSRGLRQQTLSNFFNFKQARPSDTHLQNKLQETVPSKRGSKHARKENTKNRVSNSSNSTPAPAAAEGKRKERKRKIPEKKDADELELPSSARPHKQTDLSHIPICKRVPNTRFVVDAFSFGEIVGCSGYFLSHFHSDHYGGLSSTFAYGIIYCSPITAALVKRCLRVRDCFVTSLGTDETVVIDGVEVIPVDANHCPGSVMFSFHNQSDGRTHLHTGDFRACMTNGSLQEAGVSSVLQRYSSIDTLFLDTTYLDPDYAFPHQRNVIATALRLANEALRNETRTLFVVGAYKIGKERLFVALARALGTRIYAEPTRLGVLRILLEDPTVRSFAQADSNGNLKTETPRKRCVATASTLRSAKQQESETCKLHASNSHANDSDKQELLTDDPWDAKVHVVSMMSLDYDTLRAYLHSMNGRFARVCAFVGTGWSFTQRSTSRVRRPLTHAEYVESIRKPDVLAYSLPYSEHSSFAELQWFIKRVQPHRTIATVGSYNERCAVEEAYLKPWTAAAKSLAKESN